MKLSSIGMLATALLGAAVLVGCGSDVGVKVEPNTVSTYVSGTPQERIARVEADASIPAAEKARRIKWIKEKNHLP